MKKKIGIIIFCLIILIIIALMIMFTVSNGLETNRQEELEQLTLKYINAVEKQYETAQLNSDLKTIEHGTYKVNELTALGVKLKGKMPDNTSVVSIDVFGSVSQAWLTYENKYKVYYSIATKKATVSTTNDYLDDDGYTHNIIAK